MKDKVVTTPRTKYRIGSICLWLLALAMEVIAILGLFDKIPTSQGYHLISRGFDLHHFKQLLQINRLGDIDVHKDNPTLLYYAKV